MEVKSIAHPADQAILSYLCDKDPSNSLLISGKWGAGKTHYLTVRKEQFSAGAKKKFILISVAGLATREELDQALFMASAPWLFAGYTQAVGVFAKAALRFAKIEPKDFKFSADLKSGSVVVVLDDVDRFIGDIRVVSGLVIDLIDQSRVHTIILASEDNMEDSGGFGVWRERIVGTTIKIIPDLGEMFDIFVREIADRAVRLKMQAYRDMLLTLVSDWDMSNLRVLRHAIKELARVLVAASGRLEMLGGAEKVLLGGLFLGLLEMKRDSKTSDTVGKVFSRQGLSDAAQAGLAGIESSEKSAGDDGDSDGLFVARLIQRYSGYEFSLFPGGDAFRNFFNAGVIDIDAFLIAFAPYEGAKSRREILLSEYLTLSQHDFDEEMNLLVADLHDGVMSSMNQLANVYIYLRYLSQAHAVSFSDEDVARMVIEAIQCVSPSQVVDPDSSNDFWFLDHRNEFDQTVESAIEAKREDARAAKTENERLAVFASLENESSFASRLQQWKLRPLFIGDATRIFSAISSLSPSQTQDLIRLFGSRRSISGIGPRLGEEIGTLRHIVQILSANLPTGGTYTLKESQLKKLGDVMSSFADFLENEAQPSVLSGESGDAEVVT